MNSANRAPAAYAHCRVRADHDRFPGLSHARLRRTTQAWAANLSRLSSGAAQSIRAKRMEQKKC